MDLREPKEKRTISGITNKHAFFNLSLSADLHCMIY